MPDADEKKSYTREEWAAIVASAPKLDLSGLSPEEREALGGMSEPMSKERLAAFVKALNKCKLVPPKPIP